jgi:hypothetical protein
MKSARSCGRLALLAGLVLVVATSACGDDSSTTGGGHNTGASTPTGGSGGDTGGGGSGGSGGTISTGGGGSGGDTGGSGGGTAQNGVQASDLVNAGNQASSDNYKLTHSMGQPTQNQGTMTSPSYRMQGGLIGAMGTLP